MIETLKDLSEADRQQRKRDHPSVPDHVIVKTRFSDKTANELTKSVIKWFSLSGGQAERISTMGRVIDTRKAFTNVIGSQVVIGNTRYIPTNSKKGSADISALLKIRPTDKMATSFKIEIKIGKDRQSQAQIEYQKQVEAAGGIYMIVKTWEEFIDQMKKHLS